MLSAIGGSFSSYPEINSCQDPNGSHFEFLSNPEEVTTAMESFLHRLPEQ